MRLHLKMYRADLDTSDKTSPYHIHLTKEEIGGPRCPFVSDVTFTFLENVEPHSRSDATLRTPSWFPSMDGCAVIMNKGSTSDNNLWIQQVRRVFTNAYYPWSGEEYYPVFVNPVTNKIMYGRDGLCKLYDEEVGWAYDGSTRTIPMPQGYSSFDGRGDTNYARNLCFTPTGQVARAECFGSSTTALCYYYIDTYSDPIGEANLKIFMEGATTPSFPGDTSGPGGGGGQFDLPSNNVGVPSLPALSATSAGFVTIYAPTLTQLNELSSYMWSDEFNIDSFKKLFADPMDVIIGLSIVPASVPIAGSREVKVGYVSTGVTMNLASSQFLEVSCGSLTIKEYFGSALDYSPYTKFSIFLPFIGTRELKTDDIMGKTISVTYLIDILSGSCTAHIKCGDSVLYQYSGSCAVPIPVASSDFTNIITSAVQLAGAGISAAVTGGGSAAGLVGASANLVTSLKPNVQRSGAVSGNAGMLGVKYPYLIRETPRQSLPVGYNKFDGYPSNLSLKLSDCTGFTKVSSVHIENIPCTDNELNEIEAMLKEGVLI